MWTSGAVYLWCYTRLADRPQQVRPVIAYDFVGDPNPQALTDSATLLMRKKVEIQKPLFWHQGLFLQPQHFQLSDLYTHALFQPFHKFITPYFWGVAALEISEGALSNKSLAIKRGEFLFPDGTHIEFPGNAVLKSRSFEDAWQEEDKPLPVYLGIKKWDKNGGNVTVANGGANLAPSTRFLADQEAGEVADLHQSGPAGQVKRLGYVLRIFWEPEKEDAGDYLLLPVALLEKFGEEIKLSPSYVPPSISIQSSKILLDIVKEIRDQIASRGRQLEELKAQRGIHTAEFGARDMVYLLALRSLNRYIPALFHIIKAPHVHPWFVYGALRQLVGELSSFSDTTGVLGETDGGEALPDYDQKDLGRCFLKTRALITRLLDEITAGPEYVLELVFDGTYYARELPPALFEGRNLFYLAVQTDMDPKVVAESLQTLAKLSSRESLPILIAKSLPAIGMESLPMPPQELPRRANTYYFRLDHHDDQWARVRTDKNIALYWDDAPEDLKVELMVVGRS